MHLQSFNESLQFNSLSNNKHIWIILTCALKAGSRESFALPRNRIIAALKNKCALVYANRKLEKRHGKPFLKFTRKRIPKLLPSRAFVIKWILPRWIISYFRCLGTNTFSSESLPHLPSISVNFELTWPQLRMYESVVVKLSSVLWIYSEKSYLAFEINFFYPNVENKK